MAVAELEGPGTGISAPVPHEDRRRGPHWPLVLVLAVYLGLTTGYSLVVPALEVPDEPGHAEYVLYLAAYHRLPPLPSRIFEAHQAPLYYLLEAPVLLALGQSGPSAFTSLRDPMALSVNPAGFAHGGRDARLFVHTEADVFPYAGYARAVHLMRLVSVLLGAGVVVATYRLALLLFPGDRARAGLAAALVACLPYFDLLAGAVTNDNLANLLGALVVLQVARVLVVPGWRAHRWLYLGLVLGLGLVTKQSLLAFVPFAGLALLLAVPEWRRRGVGVLALVGGMLVPAGWYLARNLYLYREPLPLAVQRVHLDGLGQVMVRHEATLAGWWSYLGEFLPSFYRTFWGVLGIYNLPLPGWVYVLYDLVAVVALAGLARLLVRWWRERSAPAEGWLAGGRARAVAVLALMLPVQLLAIVYRDQEYWAPQGRYLYVVLPVVGLFLASGLLAWAPGRARPRVAGGVGMLLALSGAWIVFGFLPPAYASPQELPPRAPLDELSAGVSYGQTFVARQDGLSRVGVRLGTYHGRATEPVVLRLKAGPEVEQDLAVVSIDTRSVADNDFARFAFPPIANSSGRTFYFRLESPGATVANMPAVWAIYQPPSEAVQRYVNDRPVPVGSLEFELGYR